MSKRNLCTCLTLALSACGGSQAEEMQEAQIAGAEESADARAEAIDERADSREEAIDNRRDLREERAERAPAGQEEPMEAKAAITQDRQQFISEARTRYELLKSNLKLAQDKARIKKNQTTLATQKKLKTAEKHASLTSDDIATLEKASMENWEKRSEEVTHRLDELEKLVEEASEAVE